jgi:hypothetical protein
MLLSPFSTLELLGATQGLTRQEISRWRMGTRIPTHGPSIRMIAKALVELRERNGIMTGDFAATIVEVATAARKDLSDRRSSRHRLPA